MAAGSPNYILIESDVALDASATSSLTRESASADVVAAQEFVRRPMRGIQLKREVFATLAVSGGGVALKNSAAKRDVPVCFTSNFLLQGVQEERSEKFQPITTFGAPFGFFFGEQHRLLSFSALLLNTADFQWEAEWWENYDKYLRGTRLVDRGLKVTLTYEDVLLEGYIIRAGTSKGEPNPWMVNLSFTMWVTGVVYLVDVGATSIDPFHTELGVTEWNSFDNDVVGAPTMLEEVRARNIKALTAGDGVGLLGALRGAVEDLTGFLDRAGAAIDGALDWLYGRNMVIPAGFAGSERFAGSAVFAEGPDAVLLTTAGGRLGVQGGSITLRSPTRVAPVVHAKGTFFEDNVDEYPARFASVVRFTPAPAVTSIDPSIAFAEQVFRNFGFNVSNDTGSRTSEVMRALGTASFAAISYAAAGNDGQDAAALLATASSEDYVSAAASQAALEALR